MLFRTRFVVVAFGISLAAPLACAKQGEGQLCNVNNHNDDCASGLVCVAAAQLGHPPGEDTCCPQTGGSTQPACIQGLTGSTGVGGMAGAGGMGGAAGSGGAPGGGGAGGKGGAATGGAGGMGGKGGGGAAGGTGGKGGTGGL